MRASLIHDTSVPSYDSITGAMSSTAVISGKLKPLIWVGALHESGGDKQALWPLVPPCEAVLGSWALAFVILQEHMMVRGSVRYETAVVPESSADGGGASETCSCAADLPAAFPPNTKPAKPCGSHIG